MNLTKAVLAVVALVFGSATTAHAQGTNAGTPAVAVKGYDVVAYFKESRAVKGMSELLHDFDGVRYFFSSAQNRAAFGADPDRFTPQFGGYCARAVSKGRKFEADPTNWKIVDGKLYVFASPQARDAADHDPELLARAHRAWKALK